MKFGSFIVRYLRVLRAFVVNTLFSNFAPYAFFAVKNPSL